MDERFSCLPRRREAPGSFSLEVQAVQRIKRASALRLQRHSKLLCDAALGFGQSRVDAVEAWEGLEDGSVSAIHCVIRDR